jgi:hypothetical protein
LISESLCLASFSVFVKESLFCGLPASTRTNMSDKSAFIPLGVAQDRGNPVQSAKIGRQGAVVGAGRQVGRQPDIELFAGSDPEIWLWVLSLKRGCW